MPDILTLTLPIYLLIGVGYAAVRGGIVARTDMRVLGQIVLRFALPALLFRMLSQRALGDILNGRFLAAYAAGSLLALAAGWLWARRGTVSYRAFVGMGMAFSNSGFVGTPVLMQWLGPKAAVPIALVMVVENLLMLPLLLALADHDPGAGHSPRAALAQALRPLARHPLILAILAGCAWSALGLATPVPLARAVDLLANASAGMALLVIGGSLVGLQVRGQGADMVAVALGKLLLHPLAVGAAMWLCLPAGDALRVAGVMLAAMPMLSIYPVLAQKHHHEGFCAATLLVTTLASFFSVSLLLWLLSPAR